MQTINLRVNSQLTDKLSFDSKVSYFNNRTENRPTLGSTTENMVYTLAIMGRYVPLDFMKEYYERTGDWGRFPGMNYNPYYVMNELKSHDERDRFIGFASLRYQINDWLSLMARGGTDVYTDNRQRIWPVGARGGTNSKGRIVENIVSGKDVNMDMMLTANGKITEDIAGTFSVGSSLLHKSYDDMSWDARNFKAEGLYHISNAFDVRPSRYSWEKEIQSIFAMGQLSYQNFVFLDLTSRRDWSSALGKDNYGFGYYSVGTSFVFSDALELESSVLTFGKIRASVASAGNDSGPFLTQSGYQAYTTNYNGQGYASMSGTIPLFDLKNENTNSLEVGFDIRLFDNKVGLDLTYYNANTYNQIISIPVSYGSGYSNKVINAGKVNNNGLEFILNATPVDLPSGFSWDVSFNFAKNNSEVKELAPGIETYLLVNNYPNNIEARPGHPYGNIIGYAYKRAPDGQMIVGSGGNLTRESEVSVLGNITPDWIGGLNNSFSYKGLSMNFLIDFVQGGEISSSTKYQMIAKGTSIITLEGRRTRDTDDAGNQLPYVGVIPGVVEILDTEGNVTGYETNTKAVDGQTYWATRAWSSIGEEFVLDASYITLREVIIGYNFSEAILSKTPFTGINLSVVGRNLFYLEEHMQDMGISPESAPNTSAGAQGIESMSLPT
ncbi:MAG: TonB-dependent receptor, partial [Cyclobacteriaceae bacterium]|nr:TonB-dependent receptor [Cyclobacteriaceae bacterium]